MTTTFLGDRVLEIQAPPDFGRTSPLSVNTDWGLVAKAASFTAAATSLWGFAIAPVRGICDGRLGVPVARAAFYIDNFYTDPIPEGTLPQIFFQIAAGSGYPTRIVWEGFVNAGQPNNSRMLLTQVSGLLASQWEVRARIDPAYTGPTPSIRLAVFFDRAGVGSLQYINGLLTEVTQTGP